MNNEQSTYMSFKDLDERDSLLDSMFFGKYSIPAYLCFLLSCFGSFFVYQGQSLSLAFIVAALVFVVALVIWFNVDGWSYKDNLSAAELIIDFLVGIPVGVYLIIKQMEWLSVFPFAVILFYVSGSINSVLIRNVVRIICVVLASYAVVVVLVLLVLGGASTSGVSSSSGVSGRNDSTRVNRESRSESIDNKKSVSNSTNSYSSNSTNSYSSKNDNSSDSYYPGKGNLYYIIYFRNGTTKTSGDFTGFSRSSVAQQAQMALDQERRIWRNAGLGEFFEPVKWEIFER